MLTPEEMATYPDNIDSMYQELDEFIIQDYARRVAKAGKVTDTAEWVAQRGEAISEMISLRKILQRLQRYMVILKRVKSARFMMTRILVIPRLQ